MDVYDSSSVISRLSVKDVIVILKKELFLEE